MVCNGVLPIDNMKDYLSPVDVLAMRIPKVKKKKKKLKKNIIFLIIIDYFWKIIWYKFKRWNQVRKLKYIIGF